MKIQVKINKNPFNQINIVGLLKACDKSLTLKQAKDMVEKEIKHKVADVDDILEFDLPNGSLVNVNFHDYNPIGEFDIIAAQDGEIPEELSLIKTNTNVLKPGMFVLVRDADRAKWKLDIFSHMEEDNNSPYIYQCVTEVYVQCIPFEGNEQLLNTNRPANSLPVPKTSEPTFDNEKKRYRVVFSNEILDYTDQELYNFITTAIIRNRDIESFTVIDIERMPTLED